MAFVSLALLQDFTSDNSHTLQINEKNASSASKEETDSPQLILSPQKISLSEPPQKSTNRPFDTGSEGFGPKIEAAIISRDPEGSMKALSFLKICETISASISNTELLRSQIPSKSYAGIMNDLLDTQSKCQTVTPNMYTKRLDLADSALAGRIQGAAIEYARSALNEGTAEQQHRALESLRKEAKECDPDAILALAAGPGARLGATSKERHTYAFVLNLFSDKRSSIESERIQDLLRMAPSAFGAVTENDLQSAKDEAYKIVTRCQIDRIDN